MFSCTWAGKSENLTIQWKSYIDILIRSTNVDRKTMQPKRMTFHENRKMEPVWTVQMNIYQSNTYRKDLTSLNVNNEPKVQERQQMNNQQSNIPVSVAY